MTYSYSVVNEHLVDLVPLSTINYIIPHPMWFVKLNRRGSMGESTVIGGGVSSLTFCLEIQLNVHHWKIDEEIVKKFNELEVTS